MSLSFCSFASGSSGNCYMIKCNDTVLLVDVGISGKRIMEGLEANSVPPQNVAGILVTHEHSDHIKSLKVASKKMDRANIYCTIGTWPYVRDVVPPDRQISFQNGEEFQIGDLWVRTFRISHAA